MSETLFKQVNYTLGLLAQNIEMGVVGLPDIQRPFVWKNVKVRDLFDSMYKGYPVGYLLFWQNAFTDDPRPIGTDQKQKSPQLLIVDGQQRLTSLYAVLKGVPIVRENYARESIEIAFNPLLQRFEVADAAIRRDKSFIHSISVLWDKDIGLFKVVQDYLASLRSTRDVSPAEEQQIQNAISRLHGLTNFPFTALELAAHISEEEVSEVFVRVNSAGKPLNQADFILTLMSVFWDDGRAELEKFCEAARTPSTGSASPFNHYIRPSPDQLLRVSVGIGFKRARLQYVYSILRGKDLESGEFSPERRDRQFGVLKAAQERGLNILYWHDFFKAIRQAGYLGGRMISSGNNLLFAYMLYLIGRCDYHIDEATLRRTIARWFFMSSITGRFTGSPETAMEFDLARFRATTDPNEFIGELHRVCDATLTNDFWSISLPNELATSSPQSPSLFAYYASLILLEAKALFSTQKVADLLDPSVHGIRSAAERHHLFPKGYLKTLGITETRDTNQIANYALVEWDDNGDIGDRAPSEYLPEFRERVTSSKDLQDMYYWHALPDDWDNLSYNEFLARRRERMARVIADAYEFLSGTDAGLYGMDESVSLYQAVSGGESTTVEFKSALRRNLHTGESDPRIELSSLKSIAGFLNSQHGGRLIIGVADDGSPVGIEVDGFPNEDRMNLHLVNLLKERLGTHHMMYIHPRFEDFGGFRVLTVECSPAGSPVFVKDGTVERFYIRAGASTAELTASQTQQYIKQRFVA